MSADSDFLSRGRGLHILHLLDAIDTAVDLRGYPICADEQLSVIVLTTSETPGRMLKMDPRSLCNLSHKIYSLTYVTSALVQDRPSRVNV